MTIDEFYTTAEVAKLFKVNNDTVRRWIREGSLKAIKINGFYRVSQSALEMFANRKFEELG